MVLWWVLNVIFLAVVIPVVVLLLNRVMAPAVEIRRYGDDVLEHGVLLIAHLDSVEELLKTRALVKQVGAGVSSYAQSLERALA